MSRTITSANSVFMISVPNVFSAPFYVQGYATDDAFDLGDSDPVEVRKGVDGRKSSGYTPYLIEQTIRLQADSPSIDAFETWLAAMDSAREDFPCDATITIQSVNKAYQMLNGSLTRALKMPPAKKVLDPLVYRISWDIVTPQLI